MIRIGNQLIYKGADYMTVKEFKEQFPNHPMKFYLMGVEDISDYPVEKLDKMIPIGCGFNIDSSIDVDVRFADMSDICSYCDNVEND